ncbi:serine acetyltransferase [bacterium]|nr:serine acetyltransferase [candidate division CSSED10-310 bacterium]
MEIVRDLTDTTNPTVDRMRRMITRFRAPSREMIIDVTEKIRTLFFPGYYGPKNLTNESMPFYIGSTLDRIRRNLSEEIKCGFCFACEQDPKACDEAACHEKARRTTDTFLRRLSHIQHLLALDIQAAYEGDPAATSVDETIFCYPGVYAITSYRIAHELYLLDVPLIPRMITEHAHNLTGIDIHPGARIGERFFIDHGTGVVIGETTIIGNGVRIYQGVTLGAKSFPLDEHGNPIKGIDRHPVVEDNVIIYSGATILGRVMIGKNSVIGGNVWLTVDVPQGSRITQRQAKLDGFNNRSSDSVG